jgi:hypothetical protein
MVSNYLCLTPRASCLDNKYKGGVEMADENTENKEKDGKKENNNMVWVIVVVFIAFFAFVAFKKMTGH